MCHLLPWSRKSRHATPWATIVWRKAISRIDAAIKVTECGNRAKRRYTVREIPSKRSARVAINLPDRSTVAIPTVSGVARHTSRSHTVTSRRDNRVEYVRAPWNWKKLINSVRERESLNYYPGSGLYINFFYMLHTHIYVVQYVYII